MAADAAGISLVAEQAEIAPLSPQNPTVPSEKKHTRL